MLKRNSTWSFVLIYMPLITNEGEIVLQFLFASCISLWECLLILCLPRSKNQFYQSSFLLHLHTFTLIGCTGFKEITHAYIKPTGYNHTVDLAFVISSLEKPI